MNPISRPADGVLRMGTSEPDDPPFSRLDGDRIVGFEPDLMQAIAREMAGGVELEAVIVARPDAFAELFSQAGLHWFRWPRPLLALTS